MTVQADERQGGTGAAAEAQEVLYSPQLHGYLMRRLRNRDDAHDLAQEAYLRFLQLPDPGAIRKPSGYLFRIAFNLISEWRLRRDRSAVIYSSDLADRGSDAAADGAPDLSEQLASRQRLNRVLEQIPLNYRRVLLMSKCEGLSNQEIARRIGVAPDTVVRYLARAVAYARKARWD